MSNYKGPQYNYIVAANTVVATDIVLDAGILSFGVPAATALRPICDFQDLIPGACKIIAGVAEVVQIDTITFTAVASTDYIFRIEQWDATNQVMIKRSYPYTSLPSGDTATTIGNAFRTAINADPRIKVAATGTTTLILTAEAGYPTFTTYNIEPTATALVLTQAGVVAIGTTAALALQGVTVGAGLTYTTVHLVYNANGIPMNSLQANQPYVLDIYIDEASSDFTNVNAKWAYILAGRETSIGGPANPEALAVT